MRKTFHYIFILITLVIVSCTPYEKILYFQEESVNEGSYYHPFELNYKIKSGDVLSVNINTGDPDLDIKFNKNNDDQESNRMFLNSGNAAMGQGYIYRMGYTVNDSGYFEMPVLGRFMAKGKSILETENLIKERLNTYIEGAAVQADLIVTRYTTLGAINNVGVNYVYEKKLNVFDAIAKAGDISDKGKKYKVNIIRHDNDGIKKIQLDLTKLGVVEKEGYYIANDDIIYIEPLKVSVTQGNIKDVLFYFSAIASTVSLILIFVTLNK